MIKFIVSEVCKVSKFLWIYIVVLLCCKFLFKMCFVLNDEIKNVG